MFQKGIKSCDKHTKNAENTKLYRNRIKKYFCMEIKPNQKIQIIAKFVIVIFSFFFLYNFSFKSVALEN